MKKIRLILVLFFCANNIYAQKTITFKDTFIVVRKVKNDTTIHQKFRFKNNGKLPLSIKSWKALNDGIECKYSKENIKPNDSGFVYFIFSIAKNSKAFSKKIELTFSNGKKKQLEITYCADNEFVFGETTHDFDIEGGIDEPYYYKFKNISNDTLLITDCDQPGEGSMFSYTKKPILPHQNFEIKLLVNNNGRDEFLNKWGSFYFSYLNTSKDLINYVPKLMLNFKGDKKTGGGNLKISR